MLTTIDEQEKYRQMNVFVTLALSVRSNDDPPCGNCQTLLFPTILPRDGKAARKLEKLELKPSSFELEAQTRPE